MSQATSNNQNKPSYNDLYLVLLFTQLSFVFILIPFLNETFIRTILGILLVIFIPGYVLIAALFPGKDDLDSIERIALSFALSIAITPLVGLLLNYTSFGITLDSTLIVLTTLTLIMTLEAYLRREKLPPEKRFYVPFKESYKKFTATFQGESKKEKYLSAILIIAILLAITTTAYVILKPKQGETFTEFYILGPNGKASNYPTSLAAGQQGKVIIGIVNHEYATVNYKLVVKNNNKILTKKPIKVQNNQKKEIPYKFTANAGQNKIEFLLYKPPNNKKVYRSLQLWVNVS